MRRIAALLAGKREKQSAPPTPAQPSTPALSATFSSSSLSISSPPKKKRSGFFSRIKPTAPIEPVPTPTTPLVSVTTPPDPSSVLVSAEDDFDRFAREAEVDRASSGGTWKAILSKRKSFTKKSRRHKPQRDLLDVEWRPREQVAEPDLNEADFDSDDEGSTAYSSSSSQIFHPPSRSPIPRSHTNLHALTLVTLASTISPHPLIHNPSKPNFPRSANTPSALPRPVPSLQIQLHKARVLNRLESRSLTPSEELSIRPFGNRPRPAPPKRPHQLTDEEAMQRIGSGAGSSRGLHRWAMRPCFEERTVVWTENEDGLVWTIVMGPPSMAVAALEYSDGLTYLATLTRTPSRRLPPAQTPPKATLPATLIPPPLSIPPPLDQTSSSSSTSTSTSTTPAPSTPTSQTIAPPLVAGDDDVPLGLTLSIKREKDEMQRLERLARAQHEREKREEQERKKKYTEEVVAARLRRERARSGGRPKSISHVDIFDDDHRPTPSLKSSKTGTPMSSNPKRRSQPTVPHHSHSTSMAVSSSKSSSSVSGSRSTPSRSSSRMSRVSNATSLSVSVPLPSHHSVSSGHHTAPATFPIQRPPTFYQKSNSSQERVPMSPRSRRNSIKSEGKHHTYRSDDTRSSHSLPRSFRTQQSVPTLLPPLPPMPYFIPGQPPMAISPGSVANGLPNARLSLMGMGPDMLQYPAIPTYHLVPPTPPPPRASHERRASGGSIESDVRRQQKRESFRVRSPLATHSTGSLPRSVSADAKMNSRPPRTIVS